MRRLHLLLLVSAVHCGTPSPGRLRLEIASATPSDVAAPRITMRTGETKLVQLLAIGGVGPVTFAARDLPRFATLQGPILTFSPARPDRGEYAMTLIATSGNETASTPLDLVVERDNTAPRLFEGPVVVHMGDDRIRDRYMRCPSPVACTAFGTPKLEALGCDAEGDRITFEVEVIRRGQPFSGEPNYAAAANDRCTCSQDPVCYLWISLPGLELEQSYDFAVRLSDEFGATEGWVRRLGVLGFDQGPCTTRQCACVPPQWICTQDYECCSGNCVMPGLPPGACE
jgi:hypothetical protein